MIFCTLLKSLTPNLLEALTSAKTLVFFFWITRAFFFVAAMLIVLLIVPSLYLFTQEKYMIYLFVHLVLCIFFGVLLNGSYIISDLFFRIL